MQIFERIEVIDQNTNPYLGVFEAFIARSVRWQDFEVARVPDTQDLLDEFIAALPPGMQERLTNMGTNVAQAISIRAVMDYTARAANDYHRFADNLKDRKNPLALPFRGFSDWMKGKAPEFGGITLADTFIPQMGIPLADGSIRVLKPYMRPVFLPLPDGREIVAQPCVIGNPPHVESVRAGKPPDMPALLRIYVDPILYAVIDANGQVVQVPSMEMLRAVVAASTQKGEAAVGSIRELAHQLIDSQLPVFDGTLLLGPAIAAGR